VQDPEKRQRYMQLKDLNEHLLRQLETGQQELDQLNSRIESLQEELSQSQVKQEAGAEKAILLSILV
jgi:prefoldin subunit 5